VRFEQSQFRFKELDFFGGILIRLRCVLIDALQNKAYLIIEYRVYPIYTLSSKG
jgi:hypothetical protein